MARRKGVSEESVRTSHRGSWTRRAFVLPIPLAIAALSAAPAHAVITFAGKADLNTGNNNRAVTTADFNGDGALDLAATLDSANQVAVWLGNGGGGFGGRTDFSGGLNDPRGVVSGDFDRDGDPDLAVSNFGVGANSTKILTNNGAGSFSAGATITTGARSQGLTTADLDGDGDLDLAVTSINGGGNGTGTMFVALGNGNGTFAASTEYDPGFGARPMGITAVDLDRDGDQDLAMAHASADVVGVRLNNGSGSFGALTTFGAGSEPTGIVNGDFNRDGKPDLAVTNRSSNTVQIMLGNGSGAFPSGGSYATDGRPTFLTATDLDRDGDLDLATANEFINNPNNDSVSVLANNGDGTFGTANNLVSGFATYGITAGDFNRDGKPDLAAANYNSGTVSTFSNTTTTGFSTSISFAAKVDTATGAGTRGVATGDFDRDGNQDVISTGTSNDDFSLLTGNGDGTLDAHVDFSMGTDPVDAAVADFNRDGNADVATANAGSLDLSVRLGNGAGSFGGAASFSTGGANPTAVAAGDLNRDGNPDLIATNDATSNVSVLLGTGTGSFGAAVQTNAGGTLPKSVALGDLDRDGDLDVVTANGGSGNVSVLLGDGTGALAAAVTYTTAAGADSVTIGDFDRDGKPDLAAVNGASSGTLSVLTGVGNGTFNAASNSSFAGNPQETITDDLNRDGDLDVLAASENAANVATRPGAAGATFGSELNWTTGSFPRSVATADFNRDGRPDVVSANNGPGNVSVLLNNGDSVAPATPTITDTDPDSPANDVTPEVKGSGAETGSTVKIYGDASCTGSVLGSGTAAAFNGATGITATVSSNTTTNLRATATDAAGNVSGCSSAFSYTHDSVAPATPTITDTDPDSPANDNSPEVKGSGAEAGTTVKIYGDATCTGAVLGSGTAVDFNGATGITVTVTGDQTTNLRATATDGVNNVSGCSGAFAYTEDSTAPSAPTINDTNPDSPANDNDPEVRGTGAEASSTVRIYGDATCTGTVLGSGTAANFNGAAGVTASVPGDATTNLRATATDAAGNTSACSSPFAYTEDSTAPAEPTISSTNPASPSNDAAPKAKGSGAEASSTVKIYNASTTGDCTGGNLLGSGTAANFNGSTGVTAMVPTNATSTLRATATDAAGNESACSSTSVTYVHDNVAPSAPTIGSTVPASPSNNPTPNAKGSGAEAGSTVKVYDAITTGDCTAGNLRGTGSATNFNGATGVGTMVVSNSTSTFRVTATDAAGNVSACSSSSVTYVHDNVAPSEPTIGSTVPASPSNNPTPNAKGSGAEAGSTVKVYDAATTGDCTAGNLRGTGTAANFNGAAGVGAMVVSNTTSKFRVTATDAAGNESACSSTSVDYVHDSIAPSAPTISSTVPASPSNNPTPNAKGSGAEAGSTVKVFDAATTGDCTAGNLRGTGTAANFNGAAGVGTMVASNSTSTFRVTATDAAGNESACSSTSVPYVHDSAAPAAPTINDTDPNSPANDNDPEVKGTGAEAGSTVRIYGDATCTGTVLGTGTAANFNGATGVTATVAGDQTTNLRVTATDAVGNASACSAPFAYTEDSTAPETTIDGGPTGATGDPTPTFAFSSSQGGSTFQCRMDTGAFAACTSPFTSGNLPDGAHTFEVRATDAAGNTDATAASRSVTVDTTAPQTTIDTGPAEGATINDPTPTFDFSSSEAGSTFECRVDSAAFGTCTGPGASNTTATLPDGSHTFEVRATDAVGNPDATPASRTFTVQTSAPPDTTPPGLIVGGATTQKFDGSIEVEVKCDEGCTVTAEGTVTVKSKSNRPIAKRGTKTLKLLTVTANQTAGQNGVLGMKLSSKDAKTVKKTLKKRGKASAAISISAADGSGNKASASRTVKLKK